MVNQASARPSDGHLGGVLVFEKLKNPPAGYSTTSTAQPRECLFFFESLRPVQYRYFFFLGGVLVIKNLKVHAAGYSATSSAQPRGFLIFV